MGHKLQLVYGDVFLESKKSINLKKNNIWYNGRFHIMAKKH